MTDLLQQKWIARRDPSHFHTLSTVESKDGRLVIQIGGDVTPTEQAKVAKLVARSADLLKKLDRLIELSPEMNNDWWATADRQELEVMIDLVEELTRQTEGG